MKYLTMLVDTHEHGMRLDKFLVTHLQDLSRSAVVRLIDEKNISFNGTFLKKNYKVSTGDKIQVAMPEKKALQLVARNMHLNILYEDDDLLVVNKEKGVVVHPAPGNSDYTLVNGLLYHCKNRLSDLNGELRPGILHRIDKDTSGLLIVAKNNMAHAFLAEQIQKHSFFRQYEAVVYGRMKAEQGTLEFPIGRNPKDRKKMCVIYQNSKVAVTHYSVLQAYEGFSHLSLQLDTGRTHQIRVHMAHIGHPVAGDPLYGPRKVITALNGQCLHAKSIAFIHPATKKEMRFDSPLPDYFIYFLQTLRK